MRSVHRIRFGLLAAIVAAFVLHPSGADAQYWRRARVHVGIGFGYPVYHPYFYHPYHWRYWSPYWRPYGWGWYPYPWYPPPPYYAAYAAASSVRLIVTPREAEVYVDGYLVGMVDDFDGFSQRLYLEPGEHEIQIYLPGYRTISHKTLFRPRQTYTLRYTLEKLGEGEPQEPRPTPSPQARQESREGTGDYSRGGQDGDAEAFGTLALRVQPPDAEVLIDGERWEAPDGDRLVIELPEGPHRLEVRKDGYRTYASDIEVQRGRVTTLNVSLLTAGSER